MYKNILYIYIHTLGYGMTQGFPTIAIPAIQGSSSSSFTLTKEQISWLSKQYIVLFPNWEYTTRLEYLRFRFPRFHQFDMHAPRMPLLGCVCSAPRKASRYAGELIINYKYYRIIQIIIILLHILPIYFHLFSSLIFPL